MKTLPVLALCACVAAHLARAQLQLRMRPSPSDHLPLPDLHESPDPALEPREGDMTPAQLRRKLGGSFDPLYSSVSLPARGNSSTPDTPAGPLPREFQQLDLTGVRAGPRAERRVRRWLWARTRCPVTSVWKDLGARFWPRYVREGTCAGERSCSVPGGMFCKPVRSVSVTLLRWHCQGPRALKRCSWIRAHYPVISMCACAC